ncbi:MAG: ABC transporter permease subunit, partial [Nocardioidaceae bacterium]
MTKNAAQAASAPPTERETPPQADAPRTQVIHGRPRYGQWIAALVVAFCVSWVVYQLVTNDAFQWDIVAEYFFSEPILDGIKMTLFLTVLAMSLSIVMGLTVAIMKLSDNPLLAGVATVYLWFFRGVPALVQLVFWFNMASLFPALELGIPFGGDKFWSVETNDLVTPLIAAVVGLGLAEGAYMAEIIRGG